MTLPELKIRAYDLMALIGGAEKELRDINIEISKRSNELEATPPVANTVPVHAELTGVGDGPKKDNL